jgi:hypothetical protein
LCLCFGILWRCWTSDSVGCICLLVSSHYLLQL